MPPTPYVAVLLYEFVRDVPDDTPLYQETITLIWARSKAEAEGKSREFAETRECTYANEAGETVRVSLKHLVDVAEVDDDLSQTAELYTRHFRDYHAYSSFEPLLNGEPL